MHFSSESSVFISKPTLFRNWRKAFIKTFIISVLYDFRVKSCFCNIMFQEKVLKNCFGIRSDENGPKLFPYWHIVEKIGFINYGLVSFGSKSFGCYQFF